MMRSTIHHSLWCKHRIARHVQQLNATPPRPSIMCHLHRHRLRRRACQYLIGGMLQQHQSRNMELRRSYSPVTGLSLHRLCLSCSIRLTLSTTRSYHRHFLLRLRSIIIRRCLVMRLTINGSAIKLYGLRNEWHFIGVSDQLSCTNFSG